MWPPSRSSTRTGRSRLTGRRPRARRGAVRSSVSVTASAAHQPSPSSTTVRQQPLTAIESPMRGVGEHGRRVDHDPGAVGDGRDRRDRPELLHDAGEHQAASRIGRVDEPDVGTDVARRPSTTPPPRSASASVSGPGERDHGAAALAEHHRCDVGDEPVGAALGHERAVQLPAALDQRLEHVVLGRETEQDRVEVDAATVVTRADDPTRRRPRPATRRRSPPACRSVV